MSAEEAARLETLANRPDQNDWGPFVVGPALRIAPQMIGSFARAGTEAVRRTRDSWRHSGMEQAILDAEARVAELEAAFSVPDFFARHGAEARQLAAELETLRDTVTRLYARWEELEAVRADVDAAQISAFNERAFLFQSVQYFIKDRPVIGDIGMK